MLWFARDRTLFHALGALSQRLFVYALFTLAWVDRGGSAKVPVFSMLLVGIMIIASMLMFAQLMQRLGDLQIGNVLQLVGDRGRAVIGEMFPRLADRSAPTRPPEGAAGHLRLGPATQTVKYLGKPRTIAKLDINSLVVLARNAGGTIVTTCAVGDTPIEGAAHLHVHGSGTPLPEDALRRAVHLERERTFEQDPKYPIRLLVDIAIKALSPAINDPTTASRPSISSRISSAVSAWLNWTPATSLTRTGLSGWSSRPRREDYLTLAFDEIRHSGSSSVQVMRRMTSALVGLAASLPSQERVEAVRRYVEHLDRDIEASPFDADDKRMARQEDRQGIGLSRRHSDTS